MNERESVRETERQVEVEQEASRELVIGWQILSFALILWIFVPDEFRVGQYFVTVAAIIGTALGLMLVTIGMQRRKRVQEAVILGHPSGSSHSH